MEEEEGVCVDWARYLGFTAGNVFIAGAKFNGRGLRKPRFGSCKLGYSCNQWLLFDVTLGVNDSVASIKLNDAPTPPSYPNAPFDIMTHHPASP